MANGLNAMRCWSCAAPLPGAREIDEPLLVGSAADAARAQTSPMTRAQRVGRFAGIALALLVVAVALSWEPPGAPTAPTAPTAHRVDRVDGAEGRSTMLAPPPTPPARVVAEDPASTAITAPAEARAPAAAVAPATTPKPEQVQPVSASEPATSAPLSRPGSTSRDEAVRALGLDRPQRDDAGAPGAPDGCARDGAALGLCATPVPPDAAEQR